MKPHDAAPARPADRVVIRETANDQSPDAPERAREIIAALVAQSRARNSGEVKR